jgi:hypothetical protein
MEESGMSMKWVESPDHTLGWIEWLYVEEETGEVEAGVQQHGPKTNWHVSSHGGLFGEFLTKEQAMKRAEAVVIQRLSR